MKLKMVIDSVVDELVRVRLTSDVHRATINVTRGVLRRILIDNPIADGRSYEITLSDDKDFNILWSGQFDENFTLSGTITVKDTTKEDLDEIRRLQKKLGLRHARR